MIKTYQKREINKDYNSKEKNQTNISSLSLHQTLDSPLSVCFSAWNLCIFAVLFVKGTFSLCDLCQTQKDFDEN